MRKAVLAVLFAAFAFLHLYRMGALSFTWDEGSDLATVSCLQQTRNPFACTGDISQTRLPFYLHAITGSLHALSFAFSALTLLAVFAYTRREYGALAATLFVALYTTSPQLLASGRMVLSHSNIIFTAFTTLSFLALFEWGRTERRAWLVASAVLMGMAAASSVLAVFNGIFVIAYLVARRKGQAGLPVLHFGVIAAATFFATTIIYCSPHLLRELIDACVRGADYPYWNYLGLGSPRAPWFFSFLLIAIKAGPWLLFALHREARWFVIALIVHLFVKSAVFGYDAPHHQVQFYPLLYMFIAAGIARWWRPWVIAIVAVLFAIQVRDVVRFFPNYLFWGSQYSERFIGEFYGPAVIHGQGRENVAPYIDALPGPILMADNNAFDRTGPRFVPFTKRDPNVQYEYAIVDRLYATHFTFPERDAYNAYLATYYTPVFTTEFPPHVWVYRVLKRRPVRSGTPLRIPPARPSSSDTYGATTGGSPSR